MHNISWKSFKQFESTQKIDNIANTHQLNPRVLLISVCRGLLFMEYGNYQQHSFAAKDLLSSVNLCHSYYLSIYTKSKKKCRHLAVLILRLPTFSPLLHDVYCKKYCFYLQPVLPNNSDGVNLIGTTIYKVVLILGSFFQIRLEHCHFFPPPSPRLFLIFLSIVVDKQSYCCLETVKDQTSVQPSK